MKPLILTPPFLESQLFKTALEASLAAAKILEHHFRTEVTVQTKSLANFVSQADLEAEEAIVSSIRSVFPNHRFLAEEGHSDACDADDLWVIDPLDGTSNYLHGISHYAVSIAHANRGVVDFGMILQPATRELFVARAGEGSWQRSCSDLTAEYFVDVGWTRMMVSDEATLSDTMIAVGFYYDRGAMMEATLAAIAKFFQSHVHGVRRFGAAALDLANVARGSYGIFMEFKLHPWDHAAGSLIVAEAGGRVTDCLGQPLPLSGPSSILATNSKLHPSALEIASTYFQKSIVG